MFRIEGGIGRQRKVCDRWRITGRAVERCTILSRAAVGGECVGHCFDTLFDETFALQKQAGFSVLGGDELPLKTATHHTQVLRTCQTRVPQGFPRFQTIFGRSLCETSVIRVIGKALHSLERASNSE